jgi:prepilin-type N-terminal cleavage/methylation domain-containing protein
VIRDERGFTMVELLVTMAILGIVLTAFGQMLTSSSNTSQKVQAQAVLQNAARVAIDRLTTDVRSAMDGDGTSPVEIATPTSFQFLSPDRGTPFHMRRISYQLVNGSLLRSTTSSTDTDGWPWAWPATAAQSYEELDSITSGSPFTYYDLDGDPTTDPSSVRSVRVSVTVSPKRAQAGSLTYAALASIRALP